MAKFYHFTPVENVSLIEKDGQLKPGIDSGKRNTYMDIQGDPNFVYLWYPGVIKIIGFLMMLKVSPELSVDKQALLEVSIDDSLVERDYDQLLYVFNGGFENKEALHKRLSLQARDYGLELKEYTPDGCKKAIDAVSDERWNKKPGSYRTAQNISEFRVISWKDVTPLYLRIFTKITGPIILKLMTWAESKREKKHKPS